MAVQAALALFRKETVNTFEQRASLLAASTTKESMREGLTVTFLVAGSGGQTAVTRGPGGDIPYGSPANSQVTATLVEKHAAEELTGFDIFASQGNQTQIMQRNTHAVIARDQDDTIITELATATQDYGSGPLDVMTIAGAQAILGANEVPIENADDMFCAITPAARAYLTQHTEFSNGSYVDVKPFAGGIARKMWRWMDINWIVSARLPGLQTANETLFMWHRDALGYAINMSEEKIFADFDAKQGKSWCRAEVYHAAKVLQNSGIIKISHDGSSFVAS